MSKIQRVIASRQPHGVFRNEKGAIDLSSIMVGVIVIGLVGGVIAATVFAIIPWAQDRAAKQQLDSIVAAQSSYMGLSSGVPPATPEGHPANSYAASKQLASAGLLAENANYCTTGIKEGKGFLAVALSGSGKYWTATDDQTQPREISPMDVPEDCGFPYVDKTPTLTKFTYKCPTTQEVVVPIRHGKGTATWSDGVTNTHTITNNWTTITRTLQAGVEYKLSFDGTYSMLGSEDKYSAAKGANCLISLDHWGSETGAKNANYAFYGATSLIDVPAQIPTSVTELEGTFRAATNFNDPDVVNWDVSNITSMRELFSQTTLFNQPLEGWDVSNVKDMYSMFENADGFNQPLEEWDVSNVEDMSWLFASSAFTQPLNEWDVSNVENMSGMLHWIAFDHPLDKWDVSNVKDMSRMFEWNQIFNQPLDMWDVSNVENMSGMFAVTSYSKPLNDWDVSNVKDMSKMFSYNTAENIGIDDWDVSNVENMSEMFTHAYYFNTPLNEWDVSKVTDMKEMFQYTSNFDQPLNKWNVSKVTNMNNMFVGSPKFAADLSGWKTSSLLYGGNFTDRAAFPSSKMPPGTSKTSTVY